MVELRWGFVIGMRQVLMRLAFVAGLGAGAGCAEFSYISGTYVTLKPQIVTIGCNEPYEVFDRREGSRMLVVSNGLREFAGCGLDGASAAETVPAETRRRRFRAAAETFLAETLRQECRLAGETAFTDLQTEFVYDCPRGGPIRPLRLPGR